MKKELIIKAVTIIGKHLVDTKNPVSATNITTLGGLAVIMLAAEVLTSVPDPTAQAVGYGLLGIGSVILFIKESRNKQE